MKEAHKNELDAKTLKSLEPTLFETNQESDLAGFNGLGEDAPDIQYVDE